MRFGTGLFPVAFLAFSVIVTPVGAAAARASATARSLLPSAIRTNGVITVATDPHFPPNTFMARDEKTIVGINPDIANAVAHSLKVKLTLVDVEFASLIPGLQAGKYDAAMSGITDTAAREKVVDFVDFATDGQAFIVPEGNPGKLSNLASMCGKTVALVSGTISTSIAREQSEKCVKDGKKKVNILLFPSAAQAVLQLRTGRAVGNIADLTKGDFLVKQSKGELEVVGDVFGRSYEGIAVPKGHPELVKALEAAVNEIIANGKYHAVLSKWGVVKTALPHAVVNGATQAPLRQ